MALNAHGKNRSILEKILPSGKHDSKKPGSSGKKKSKRNEIKLEAFSVSENFDPETYIIPLQNKWTFGNDHAGRASDISTNDDEGRLISTGAIISNEKANKWSKNHGKIVKAQIYENPAKDDSMLPKKVTRTHSKSLRKDKVGVSNSDPSLLLKNLDGLNGIGYVPSHPKMKQRTIEREIDYEDHPGNETSPHLHDSWTVQLNQSDVSNPADSTADQTAKENRDSESRIENIVLLHDKITSMPGMVESFPADEYLSELDIDRVELVAESDEYDYDDSNDRWSFRTPSLPPISLSSSNESLNRGFDQSSQSDFSALAYKRSKLPSKNHAVVEVDENELEPDLFTKVTSLQRSYHILVEALEDQKKNLLRKGEISDRKERTLKKQRGKEAKVIDQRFTRLESHVITLARSVAHLSAELKSQNTIRQHVANVQKDVYELKSRRTNEMKYLQDRVRLVQTDKTSQKTIRKLRRFFGADPGHPLLCNLLEELGYEEYASIFQKAKIGIMELPYTSEDQLKDIGIPSGPRKRILENIKHLY